MTVKEIPVSIRCLEYRQDKSDTDYGSCLYARFYFNLDKYELNIISDVGDYGYQWVATPEHESFLEHLAQITDGYLLGKLCGSPKEFDYEATKAHFYDYADVRDYLINEYTAYQKKIVSVFENHIQPVIRKMVEAEKVPLRAESEE